MAVNKTEAHRPGPYKQSNKAHKTGRHRSKGQIDAAVKGKSVLHHAIKKHTKKQKRIERRNIGVQLRKKKVEEACFLKRRGPKDPPFLIAVVSLNEVLSPFKLLELFEKADEGATISHSAQGYMHMSLPIMKQRFTIMALDTKDLFKLLDALKVADIVIFAIPVAGIDELGELAITSILAQGLPTYSVTITGLQYLPINKHSAAKHDIQRSLTRWLPEEKLQCLDKPSDALNLFRRISGQKKRSVIQRDRRAHLLAENLDFKLDSDGANSGTLAISGYLRGQSLSVNSLVHIPGVGDFQMSEIWSPGDPYPLSELAKKIESSPIALAKADPALQESLESENTPDPMDAEQTWPTAEELQQAAENRKKKVIKVPKGFSEYQAAWIMEDAEEVEESGNSGDEDEEMEVPADDADSDAKSAASEEEYDTLTVTSEAPMGAEKYDAQMDIEGEQKLLQTLKDAKTDAAFPDEVDTPQNMPARVRFQKYRGLQSFRTSPWDPKENLPLDYARIFQFQNFDRTKKRILKEQEEKECIPTPGTYITVLVKNVTKDQYQSLICQPTVLYGLLPYEQKMSVLNLVLRRSILDEEQLPIKSKEPMVFQCGYRRFKACPVFSQHTNGAKHKFERYFQPNSVVVATVFAPIVFPPCSVLAFKPDKNNLLELVATGSVLSVNPDRIILKRVVLSGHPLKVRKRSAIVRFMFFNREDIEWFKPVELNTKYGRRGHIKEPLGTHGHMKCVFDGQLKSQDSVLLTLYKRVFPKWTYDTSLPAVTHEMDTE
ncbi:unnamed protein product [Bemisia tabaci]|uniref:Pre-rRNA-processing protein TSR1 homolog n=1 Tax=Bemisia tabaci TaxID=7038 RepID=A0A9P0F4N9_BEMTA|nr:unnamed protein product [Bemisia tabaci]